LSAAPRIWIGTREKTLPCTRKMVSTTMLNTVSAIITEIDRLTSGRPWEDLKARSAMSWNHMALTTLDRRKKGRTHRVEKATERMGSVYDQRASALELL